MGFLIIGCRPLPAINPYDLYLFFINCGPKSLLDFCGAYNI
jgi:hypothetical protein